MVKKKVKIQWDAINLEGNSLILNTENRIFTLKKKEVLTSPF